MLRAILVAALSDYTNFDFLEKPVDQNQRPRKDTDYNYPTNLHRKMHLGVGVVNRGLIVHSVPKHE
jgi:hypothetical protein